ncbi:MAG TPA: DUF305 domain-containing protein [Kofleriaceae bacterium]|nr:DUF305 domain-containing protein [Kofleriaceae bacterium]
MRKSLLLAVALAASAPTTVALAHPKDTPTAETKPMPAPKDDHMFAMHMAQHHRDGIAMADAVIARGTSDDVKSIAKRIKSDQEKDLTTLDAKLKGHKMAGMPKDADMERDMARLKAAKGADADRLFLELMIVHHAEALVMGHSAMDKLADADIKKLARDMFDKQARDIGELQKLRGSNVSAQK